ncbi:unnamed protein product [Linum tenue]|uniref:Phytocyanin domain-containing protein n=2 Tax=Linum tenue TaxID=586396 RepID=A0AAV0L646_9ROSI|nr:unnamed protein product [Linum tenue]
MEAGAVHKVGDSAGWTTIGSLDSKQWAVTKTFQLGDVIRKSRPFSPFPLPTPPAADFEYNPQFHNVMRLTHAMYRACNTTAPSATYTTGNDSITITTRGHHYFICGFTGHCHSGQKVDINVLPTTTTAVGTPSSSPMAAPTLPSAQSPGPSPNTAASSMPSITLAKALLLALAILGFA